MIYEERNCVICGLPFEPQRRNQVTCNRASCKKERHRRKGLEWKNDNYDYILALNRKRREEQMTRKPKPDTIVAIGYAERQVEKTLKSVPKIDTNL
jgi:hypothetical protein